MYYSQSPYRELLALLDGGQDDKLETIIGAWLAAQTAESAWLGALGRVSNSKIPAMSVEDLSRLYALSRVSDALIKRIEKDGGWARHYSSFMEGLGLTEYDYWPMSGPGSSGCPCCRGH